jgi:xanthine dehydrogenase YagS FAD-binding subunit
VAPLPWRARTAEEVLRGAPADEEAFGRAADLELADARPLRDNRYKVGLTRNVVVRTLMELLERP